VIFSSRQSYNLSEHRRHRLLSAIPAGTRRLLDIGCGSGFITAALTTAAEQVVAVDLFAEALSATRSTCGGRSLCVQVAQPAAGYPFKDDTFDVVTAFEVIEHCRDPRRLLTEITRVLKPGGQLVLTTPNYKNFQRRLGVRAFRGLPRFPPFPIHWAGSREDGTHFKEFEPSELGGLLEACGFAIDVLRGDFVGFALWRGTYTIQVGSDWLGARFPAWSVDLLVRATRRH
jgi:SAM-dependent methyltransferase